MSFHLPSSRCHFVPSLSSDQPVEAGQPACARQWHPCYLCLCTGGPCSPPWYPSPSTALMRGEIESGFECLGSKVVSEFKAFYYCIYYFKLNRVFIVIIIREVLDGKVVRQDNE